MEELQGGQEVRVAHQDLEPKEDEMEALAAVGGAGREQSKAIGEAREGGLEEVGKLVVGMEDILVETERRVARAERVEN